MAHVAATKSKSPTSIITPVREEHSDTNYDIID